MRRYGVDITKNNGQLSKVESYIGTDKQWSQRFGYDQLGRLKESREYRGDNNSLTYKQVFDFDRFGNMYRKAANNGTSGQASPLPYTPIEDSDISRTTNRLTTGTTYNEAGMVVGDTKFRDMAFSYDANGRMVKATKTSVPDASTVYDALGNRVAAKVDDVWQVMVYDAFGKLVAEYGEPQETFGSRLKYVQQDWQGSVRTVSNQNGYVISRTDHSAYGETIGAGVGLRSTLQGYFDSPDTRQGYGLTERDEATGLDHTWFRKIEGQAGRWTSPDPYKGSMSLGTPKSFNRFAYVENDPLNFVDPTGLSTCGINPVTGRPGINATNSGRPGDLRPGERGLGHFGARRNNAGRRYTHTGTDIAAPVGTPIFAFAPGTVKSISGSASSTKGYGLTVVVDHGNGYTSHYSHLSATDRLKVGATAASVSVSGQIGNSGQSGNANGQPSTEAHLHFEIRLNGVILNPEKFLNSPCPKNFNDFRPLGGGGGGGLENGYGFSYGGNPWSSHLNSFLFWLYSIPVTHTSVRVLEN